MKRYLGFEMNKYSENKYIQEKILAGSDLNAK
jgi:hypothetical protein